MCRRVWWPSYELEGPRYWELTMHVRGMCRLVLVALARLEGGQAKLRKTSKGCNNAQPIGSLILMFLWYRILVSTPCKPTLTGIEEVLWTPSFLDLYPNTMFKWSFNMHTYFTKGTNLAAWQSWAKSKSSSIYLHCIRLSMLFSYFS